MRRVLGVGSATALVIAAMVGAGIFTTTGQIAPALGSGRMLLLAWLVSGLLALMGALCYAELGAALPEAGGEYAYCQRAYGATVGFLTGIVSTFVGFAVSIAGIAIPIGDQLAQLAPWIEPRIGGCAAVVLLACVHGYGVREGARFNDVATLLKVVLMLAFVAWGLLATPTAGPPPASEQSVEVGLFSAPFASSLITLAFAFLGWNMACYLGGEVREPGRSLPRALLLGTAFVTALYLLVNLVFLRAARPHEMLDADGEKLSSVGAFAAQRLFGEGAATGFTLLILLLLLSTLSAMTMGGARLIYAMARRKELPRSFEVLNRRGAPVAALALQAVLSIAVVWYGELGQIYTYIGVLVTLSAALTSVAVIVLRRREPELARPFRVPLYPLPPLAFAALASWMIFSALRYTPMSVAVSAATLLAALALRPLLRRRGV